MHKGKKGLAQPKIVWLFFFDSQDFELISKKKKKLSPKLLWIHYTNEEAHLKTEHLRRRKEEDLCLLSQLMWQFYKFTQ